MGSHHELPHGGTTTDEWIFAAWTTGVGVISGYRIAGRTGWYFTAIATEGRALVTLCDCEVPVRSESLVVKAEGLWADHICDEPMRQWTISNEAMAVALDDPDLALDRAYGVPTALAMDLEWYAVADAEPLDAGPGESGYVQNGVVHGLVEVAGREPVHLTEVSGRRWRRWANGPAASALGPLPLSVVRAHRGLRAPFRFVDDSVLDLVLTGDGWQIRDHHGAA
jgi:hypothetical protein